MFELEEKLERKNSPQRIGREDRRILWLQYSNQEASLSFTRFPPKVPWRPFVSQFCGLELHIIRICCTSAESKGINWLKLCEINQRANETSRSGESWSCANYHHSSNNLLPTLISHYNLKLTFVREKLARSAAASRTSEIPKK